MKKILTILLITCANLTMAQLTTLQLPFRVVSVSPNYTNLYPRYNTLQAVYTGIKDSASVITGKYFIVNIVSSHQNITDYTSGWKDSIVNRDPYMKLTSFGQAINDSIIGITIEEFTLIAGILGLNPATAGVGLGFSSHAYYIITQNYLGNALYLDGDSLKIRVQVPLYFTPNLIGIKVATNSGIRFSDSVYIVPYKEVYTDNDTLLIRKSFYFMPYDSLTLDWNTQHFNLTYGVSPSINIRLDSGITAGADGIRAWLDNARVKFTSGKKITLPNSLAGTGITWTGDSLNLTLGDGLIMDVSNKIISVDVLSQHFAFTGNYLSLLVDSGLSAPTFPVPATPKVLIDNITLKFDASKVIFVSPAIAGDGLLMTTGIVSIIPNEFAEIENDTLKIKTSYTYTFYGDSLTSNVTGTGIGVLPFDSTGICTLAKGKIKRITYTYQLASGNDTVITTINNIDINNSTDKLRCVWVNGSSQMRIQTWTLSSRTWVNAITLSFPSFANNKWRIVTELYAEAQ